MDAIPYQVNDPERLSPAAVTIADLLNDMEAAHDRMSVHNPTRALLYQAAAVIVAQAHEIVRLHAVPETPLILPG